MLLLRLENVLFLMFMIINEKMSETKNTVPITTRNKRIIITCRHRTKVFIKRETYVLHIFKRTRICW